MPGVLPRFRFVPFIVLIALSAALAAGNARAVESVLETESILTERSIASRVLGGSDAEEGDWPGTVALVRFGNRSLADRLFCGGTVVAERWVMTAAHCLYTASGAVESASSIRAVGGITDLATNDVVDEVIVTNIFIHPDYDNSLALPPNDIALLELATIIDATPVELFAGDATQYTSNLGYIVGWGATAFVNNVGTDLPEHLQDATVPLVSTETCNQPDSYGGIVSTRQICAGFEEGGIDTCSGDSGGPLYLIEDGQVVQVGITSFGDGCGLPDKYGIYTDVSQFVAWLGDYITVPAQSAELLSVFDSRENGVVESNDREAFAFLGAFQPLSLLVLLCMMLFRFGRQVRAFTTASTSVSTRASLSARASTRARARASTSTRASTRASTGAGISARASTSPCKKAKASTATTRSTGLRLTSSASTIRNTRGKLLPLLSAAMLLSTGCSVSSAISGDKLAKSLLEDDAAMLTFSEHSGRAGLADISLGQSRNDAVAAIESLPVLDSSIVCQSKKTGLKGTGRAFFNETCVFEAVMGSQSDNKPELENELESETKTILESGQVSKPQTDLSAATDTSSAAELQINTAVLHVATLAIKRITAEFLDEQLVGLQVVAEGESTAPLVEHLNSLYTQVDASGGPLAWQSTHKDAIRLLTSTDADNVEASEASEVSVELVSAGIDGRLPTLFEF